MAARHLPGEIIETILLKLPIKSLLRFKSVSKSWNSMISDLRFIRTHYELSMANSENNLFLKDDGDGWFSIVRWEGRQLKYEARDTFLSRLYKTFLCIGDGLVLLDSYILSCFHNTYMLWNPRTRQDTILRFPYSNSKMYGVCYDPMHEDVKVVISSKYFYSVYSCKSRSWAKKKEFPFGIAAEGGLAVDGAIYWVLHNGRSMIIVCFDSKDDSFKILQKPEDQKEDESFQLKVRKARLYLFCNGEDVLQWGRWEKGQNLGKGNGRRVLVNIDNLYNVSLYSIVVAPLTENEMIMRLGWGSYCIYNCCDKSYQEFEVEFEVDTTLWMHPFVGSMFRVHI